MTLTRTWLIAGAIVWSGCYEPGGRGFDGETDAMGTAASSGTSAVASSDATLPTSITDNTTLTTMDPGESGSSAEDDSTGQPVEPDYDFDFDDTPPEDYVQIDRAGMPLVSRGLITSRDAYNAATPYDDDDGMFIEEILASLTGLHEALDDDLIDAGLVPCDVAVGLAQLSPLILPDTIKISLGDAPGFPNGWQPSDTAADITLAFLLLDFDTNGQNRTTLVGTNPTHNDRAFMDEFPYFAPPHE